MYFVELRSSYRCGWFQKIKSQLIMQPHALSRYLLPVHPLDRALAIGFCLYSCFYVINDSIFETLIESYLGFWGFLDVLTFLASLVIWIRAVRIYSEYPATVSSPQPVAAG
jgi:hypothetical protein